nr:hypothetical protein [Tanacetum cinerariifolium]
MRGHDTLEVFWDVNYKDSSRRETIHDYYVQFAKLINDMRNIQMTMSRMQLNSNFVNNMLPERGRFVTAVKLYKGLRDSNYDQLVDRIKDGGTMHEVHVQLVMGELKTELGMLIQENGVALDEERLLFIAWGQDNAVDEDVDEQPVQDLALNVDNVFQADDCDSIDSDVDEAPTTQTMFMANLSSTDPVYDEAGPSCDSNILSEVHDHDHYQDAVCEHHEVHDMHDDVQPNYIVDSHVDYTSDSNMIMYDQYVKDSAVPAVQSNVSSVPNDAYMMILNDMHEQPAQHVSVTMQNNVVDKSLTAELATYKEQIELYKRRATFELTEREQKIDEQLRIVITNRNIKEEKIKNELHSVKMQLASTINHNKLMVEEVTSLKKDFKQKENKYLEEFLDMKALKEKYKVAIGYKKPLCLTHAKQVQPALYNGLEIIKTDHVSAIVHNSEDTLGIAEITRKKMNEKIKTTLWTHNKINIRPPDYSKENFLATFTPQTQLTFEQIFWSKDVLKMKTKALAEQAKATKPVRALTVYPLNTPVKLVPRVLPTKSQVKINIFALIQLFLEFEKTCKTRITPKGLTDGERGFEQTKECHLIEETRSDADRSLDFRALDFQITQLTEKVSVLQEQNELFRVENAKVKQQYRELYDSIKTTHPKHIDQTIALLTENENLKVQIIAKLKCITIDSITPKVLAPGMYVIDVKPIPPRLRNNREVYLDYLKHLKKSVETLCEIVEEAKVERPLDRSLTSACLYTKHSHELLEYVIGTCPKDFNKRDKKHATTPLTRKKQVTFVD